LTPTDDRDAPGLDANIELVEPLGAESYLYFVLDGEQYIGRTEETPPQPGERTHLTVDPAKIHLFSADGERRLDVS
jgi:ABC-type sugar transport system ATPase subunit